MNSIKLRTIFLLSIMIALGSSCGDNEEPAPVQATSVVVLNEGNFSAANGSFDVFDKETQAYQSSIFNSSNNFPVGATIQNAIIADNYILATTNSVDKLEVIDKTSFESVATVTNGMKTPFGVAANDEFAFVTNWGVFNNETFVYDDPRIITVSLATFEVVSTVGLNVQPQHAVFVKDRLYVSDVGNFITPGNTISVYEISGGIPLLESTISVPNGPDKMVIDENENIWVICTSGSIVEVNTSSNSVSQTISNIPALGFNEKMTIDHEGQHIFWIASSGFPDYNSGVYTMAVDNPVLSDPIIEGTNFHGIGVDNNALYLGDHAAYQATGSIYKYSNYDTNPSLEYTLSAGLAPNGFLFK